MDRIGLTFEEYAELKVRPRVGADAAFGRATLGARGRGQEPDGSAAHGVRPGVSQQNDDAGDAPVARSGWSM